MTATRKRVAARKIAQKRDREQVRLYRMFDKKLGPVILVEDPPSRTMRLRNLFDAMTVIDCRSCGTVYSSLAPACICGRASIDNHYRRIG